MNDICVHAHGDSVIGTPPSAHRPQNEMAQNPMVLYLQVRAAGAGNQNPSQPWEGCFRPSPKKFPAHKYRVLTALSLGCPVKCWFGTQNKGCKGGPPPCEPQKSVLQWLRAPRCGILSWHLGASAMPPCRISPPLRGVNPPPRKSTLSPAKPCTPHAACTALERQLACLADWGGDAAAAKGGCMPEGCPKRAQSRTLPPQSGC